MGVRTVRGAYDDGEQVEVAVDSATGVAFGPVFASGDADEFLDWLPEDPRKYRSVALGALYDHWKREHRG